MEKWMVEQLLKDLKEIQSKQKPDGGFQTGICAGLETAIIHIELWLKIAEEKK